MVARSHTHHTRCPLAVTADSALRLMILRFYHHHPNDLCHHSPYALLTEEVIWNISPPLVTGAASFLFAEKDIHSLFSPDGRTPCSRLRSQISLHEKANTSFQPSSLHPDKAIDLFLCLCRHALSLSHATRQLLCALSSPSRPDAISSSPTTSLCCHASR